MKAHDDHYLPHSEPGPASAEVSEPAELLLRLRGRGKLPPLVLPEGMTPEEYIQQRNTRFDEAATKVPPEDWEELSEIIRENRRLQLDQVRPNQANDENTSGHPTSRFRTIRGKLPPLVLPEGMTPEEYIQQRMDRIREASKDLTGEMLEELSEIIRANRLQQRKVGKAPQK